VRTRSESRRQRGKVPACVAERVRYDTAHRHVSLNLVGRAKLHSRAYRVLLRAKCAHLVGYRGLLRAKCAHLVAVADLLRSSSTT
jgi:hypothetical protein